MAHSGKSKPNAKHKSLVHQYEQIKFSRSHDTNSTSFQRLNFYGHCIWCPQGGEALKNLRYGDVSLIILDYKNLRNGDIFWLLAPEESGSILLGERLNT